jgi:hypothetical protein
VLHHHVGRLAPVPRRERLLDGVDDQSTGGVPVGGPPVQLGDLTWRRASQLATQQLSEHAIDAFAADYGIKWPKAVAKVTGETERLLCFFDYPAEHWVHLRTTNPIESSFSPVRARTRVTKGPGTKDTGLAMVFKLLQAAEGRWRAVNGPHLVALVRAGARFEKGKLIERPDETPDKEADGDVTKVAA